MKMFGRILLFFAVMWSSCILAQSPPILITDPDMDSVAPMDCNLYTPDPLAPANFYDSGGNSANYSDNESETLTVCPDLALGSKVTSSFAMGGGLNWDVDGSDTLYVFDGPSVSAPLLGAFNSVTDPTGFVANATWSNPSGCLTFHFVSDASINATGWEGTVSCGNLPQPFEPHMVAFINGDIPGGDDMSPADTGYVDVCFGDSILFVATPIFPHDVSVTGSGYDQINTYTVEWDFSDGSSATGDSVWFTPPARSGYLVSLKVTDPILLAELIISKARVSTIPSFLTCEAIPDTFCLGGTANLIGGVTATDTAGVDGTVGSFQLGGSFAGLTFLPDGSGVSHVDSLSISGFGGGTITSSTDLEQLCINIEHSYLGDLDITLTCPSGVTLTLMDTYTGGGGGTFLGDALDDATLTPGVGLDYCWSMSATWGTMSAENAAGNWIPSTVTPGFNVLSPGTFSPVDNWAGFIGCPIDGDWIITITDNIGADNGYLFEWGLFFDPSLNPYSEFYTPLIQSEQWLADSTIISGTSDTAIIVQPIVPGDNWYTFQVTDNFGCTYDTTIMVYALNGPELIPNDTACNNSFQVTGTFAPEGGEWTYSGPGSATFFPNTTFINPRFDVDDPGLYTFTFTDVQCRLSTDLEILFMPDITADLQDYFFCEGESQLLDVTENTDPTVTYLWSTSATSPSIEVVSAGTYSVDLTGYCNDVSASSVITTDPCIVVVPNVISVGENSNGQNDYFVMDGLFRWPNTALSIFNRWGQKIYHSDNYQNDWDGRNGNNGQVVPSGTYYYVVVYSNGESETGHVTVFHD